jgi:hypothetical protein
MAEVSAAVGDEFFDDALLHSVFSANLFDCTLPTTWRQSASTQ